MRNRIDLALLDRRHAAGAAADADEGGILRLAAGLGDQEVGEEVGRRARRGDADLHALEVGRGLHLTLRSEEHTSELQSLMRISYAVFCLKKKIINNNQDTNTNT